MAASGVTVFEQNKEQLPQPKPPKDKVLLDERGLLDLPFLALTVLLVLIGVIMMFSASYARAYQEKGISTYYFARQAVFAVLGIAGMLFVSRLNYQMWRFASFIVLGVSVFFLLLVPFIGEASHGAKRWITVAGIRFQPSELAKVAIVMSFASLMSIYREKMQTFKYGILPFALILVVICGLVALERHFSCILIMLALGAVMMFLGGVRLRWFIIGGVAVAAFAAIYLARMGYAGDRVTACRTRADEHGSAHGNVVLPEHPPGDPVEIANQRQGQEQKQQIENRHTPGQIYAHDLADGDLCHRRSQGRENDISQLVNAGIAPQTLIQMKQRKEQNGDNGIHRRSFQIAHHKFGLLQGRDAELKPHQQGRQRREVDGKQVENHQRQHTLAAHVIPFNRLFLH